MIGRTISHYRIVEKLAGEGWCRLQGRRHAAIHRLVALKFSPRTLLAIRRPSHVSNAKRKPASALNHPNICTIYDIGEEDGQTFIAMEYLDGLTLKPPHRGEAARLICCSRSR